MSSHNGESGQRDAPLELSDVLQIETNDGASLAFEVVGILEDPTESATYAVLHHESEAGGEDDQFIVTDLRGNLLDNETLAQEILDDFLAFAEEETP
jgi:hypothetical protein